jgi:molecular chaperone DnaJ
VTGGTLEVETPYGPDKVKLAAGTPADHVVKLVNAGVPRLQGAGRGDLYLHLRVAVPKSLNAEQRQLVEQLRRSLDGEATEGGDESFLSKVFGSEKGGKKKRK